MKTHCFFQSLSRKNTMGLFLKVLLSGFCFSPQALVLNWSGGYQMELFLIQSTGFSTQSKNLIHNLHLQPEIVAYEGVHIRSGFHLVPPPPSLPLTTGGEKSHQALRFYPQDGVSFDLTESPQRPPGVFVRDLYVEIFKDFFAFHIGWKPHHFGLGMYYNDGSEALDPVYSLRGGRGSVSARFFVSSFYLQPLVYLDHLSLLNTLIQAGFEKEDHYKVEGLYRKSWDKGLSGSAASGAGKKSLDQSYFGLYGLYQKNWHSKIEVEVGGFSQELFAAALQASSLSPWKWMQLQLQAGLSYSSLTGEVFYMDPNFSTGLVPFSTEGLKNPLPPYHEEYTAYAFHEGFYISPGLSFSLSKKWVLDFNFSTQFLFKEKKVKAHFYNLELTLNYQWNKHTSLVHAVSGVIPASVKEEGGPYLGFLSQAAITF